jgi:hypothetical protein
LQVLGNCKLFLLTGEPMWNFDLCLLDRTNRW